MKKALILLALLLAFTSIGLGQGSGPITVKEVDGSPVCNNCRTFVFPNGSLTVSGNKVTVASGGGGGGSGDVTGPASATDNAIVRFNTTTGKLIQNSVVTIADTSGNMAGVGTLNTHTIPGGTDTFTLNSATQTLTNKTFVAPILGTPASGVATNLTGTASGLTAGAATVLATARTINGTSFDGSANITVTAAAGTLTGSTLASGVTASSLTSHGTITSGGLGTGAVVGGVTMTLGSDADGDMYYRASNVLTRLPKGTAGQVLTMNAGATAPEWAAGGGGGGITIGTTTITSGTNTRVLFNNSGVVGEYTVTGTGNAVLSASPTLTGTLTAALADFAGAARSSGVASYFRIQTPADTAQTASTESIGSQFGGNSSAATVTRQWSTGALTTQRENVFVAPTYGFVGASTLTTAATVAITNAPAAGTNATITDSYALWVQAGNVRLAGSLVYLNGVASTDAVIKDATAAGLGEGTLAVGRGNNALVSGAVIASGFYANQFGNNNSTMTVAISRSAGITLASDLQLGWQSATSGAISASKDTGLIRSAAAAIRVTNGSTGGGNLLLGTSTVGAIGTSGVSVLAIANGTAPTSSPADEFQLYSADSAAGDANAFARNEAGEINRLTGLTARNSAQFDKTSDTTLANVTGLTRNVEAGRTYAFTAVLYTTSNVAGGVKAAIGGTATATSIVYEAEVKDGSTFATMGTARATSLATTVGDVTAVTAARITITGTIVVEKAGTLTVQFAQNASNGTASSVLVNSSFQLIPIS